jgi:hypothetical protein
VYHIIHIKHRDEVEAPITDWLREAYELSDLSASKGARLASNRSDPRSPTGLRFDESLLTISRVLKPAKAKYAKLQ